MQHILGHLEVIKSPLVNEIISKFEDPIPEKVETQAEWESIEVTAPLRLIFAVDGSKQNVRSDISKSKEVSFVKTALLRLDQHAVEKLDQDAPHAMELRDIMTDAAMFHSTVIPLKGIRIDDKSIYDAVREIIYHSLKDPSLNEEPYKTLKWLAYEKWTDDHLSSPSFQCPHCSKDASGLPYDADEGECEHCGGHLFLSDMIANVIIARSSR